MWSSCTESTQQPRDGAKKGTLEGNYKAFVLPEEVSDSKLVHEKLREVLNNGEAWKQKYKKSEEEIYELYICMAQEIHAHETEREKF